MGRKYIVLLLLSLFIVSLVPSSAVADKGTASEKIVFKGIERGYAVAAITSGKIDAYLYGVSPDTAKSLASAGVTLYTAPSNILSVLLNPAPVEILLADGNMTNKEAAERLGLPVYAVHTTYIPADANLTLVNKSPFIGIPLNKTNVTVVELCAKPRNTPPMFKILWENGDYEINPFCIYDVRKAVSAAIDRGAVVEKVYKGYAIPMYWVYTVGDPIYPYVAEALLPLQADAQGIVEKVMSGLGAVKKNGIWYYNGRPVTIVGVARVEDERREIGYMLSNWLKELGFNVKLMNMKFGQAISTVYFSDPKTLKWFFYTEGWGKSGLSKWPGDQLLQFLAPISGWLPGLGNPAFWNYRNPLMDYYGLLLYNLQVEEDEVKRLSYLDYLEMKAMHLNMPIYIENEESYTDFLKKALTAEKDTGLVRIFIAEAETIIPVRPDVTGVTLDLGSGLANPYFYRTAKPGSGDTLKLGNRYVYTPRTVWEPFGGFNDVYSVDVLYAVHDPWIWPNPFNGEPIAFRATYIVKETYSPLLKMRVPDTALWWDARNHRWVPAKQLGRTFYRAKVVFDLSKWLGHKWHDGEPITMADIAAYIAELVEIASNPAKASLDPDTAAKIRNNLNTIVGVEFHPDKKQLVVYLNYWHFDPSYVAAIAAYLDPSVPATITIAADYLAYVEKKYALGDSRARATNIPHLNMIVPEEAEDVYKALSSIDFNAYRNYFKLPNGDMLMTLNEWLNRVARALKFIHSHKHAFISDGAFYIYRFDIDTQTVEARAWEDEPVSPEELYYGVPEKTTILEVAPSLLVTGKPATILVKATGEPTVKVKWILIDPEGFKVLSTGEAVQSGSGVYKAVIPASDTIKLEPGKDYLVRILAYSDSVASVDQRDVVVKAIYLPSSTVSSNKTVTELEKTVKALETKISLLNLALSKQENKLNSLQEQVEAYKSTAKRMALVAIAVAGAALALSVYLVLLTRKEIYR